MRSAALLLVTAAVSGCSDQSMTRQPHYGPNSPTSIFASGSSAQTPPEGAVSQESFADMTAAADPPPVDMALLRRGKERFEIFCAPCHGFDGDGDGAVVRRGFPRPPSYYQPALMAAPGKHVFDTITDGFGIMYSYASRIPPHDRWAIVAYIRALQQSRSMQRADAPDVDKAKPRERAAP